MTAVTDRVLALLPNARLHSVDPESEDVIIWGPPGTGKTWSLNVVLDAHLQAGWEPDKILVNAFTRSATQELQARLSQAYGIQPQDMPWVRTIHSSCFRLLGLNTRQVVGPRQLREFGEETGFTLKGVLSQRNLDDPYGGQAVVTLGDWCYVAEELRRQRQQTVEQLVDSLRPPGLAATWDLQTATEFSRVYAGWKREAGLWDFADMLEKVLEHRLCPPIQQMFVDEAQDNTPLVWAVIDLWRGQAERLFVFGDDDQCQPPGTMVTIEGGAEIPIEELDPAQHRLVSYDRGTAITSGWRKGHSFKVESHRFNGELIKVSAGGHSTRCTPEHRWLVRWTEAAKSQDVNVVYLMRQGSRFRVGWCQLIRADGTFHLGARARFEKADAAWILATTKSKTEASVLESIVAARWGLPTMCFEPRSGANHMTREAIDATFDGIGDVAGRADQCLLHHGRRMAFPLWVKKERRHGNAAMMEVRACNLIADLMSAPLPCRWGGPVKRTAQGRCRVAWQPIDLSRSFYIGPVYSLDVDKHPYYIADGIVTHNSLFEWSGADPRGLWSRRGHQFVLAHSYRLTERIHGAAQQIIRRTSERVAKDFEPDRPGGVVSRAFAWHEVDYSRPGSWLLLCRNRVFGEELRRTLIAGHVPFRDRTSEAGVPTIDSPLGRAVDALWRLQQGQQLPKMRLRFLRDILPSDMWPRPRIDRDGALVDLAEMGASAQLCTKIATQPFALLEISRSLQDYLSAVLRSESGLREPRIEMATIHWAKGREADNVVVGTAMTNRTHEEYQLNPDAENRVYYVAATRARERLTWVMNGGKGYVI